MEVGAVLPQARSWGRDLEQILPQSLQREPGSPDTLILDFWPPGLWENKFLLFQATQACSTLLRQLQETHTISNSIHPPLWWIPQRYPSSQRKHLTSLCVHDVHSQLPCLYIHYFHEDKNKDILVHESILCTWWTHSEMILSGAEWWKSTGVTYTGIWDFRRWGSANRKKRGHFTVILAQSKLKIQHEPQAPNNTAAEHRERKLPETQREIHWSTEQIHASGSQGSSVINWWPRLCRASVLSPTLNMPHANSKCNSE